METTTVVLSPDDLERLVKIETLVQGIRSDISEMKRYIPQSCIETHEKIKAIENQVSAIQNNLVWVYRTAGATIIVALISMVMK